MVKLTNEQLEKLTTPRLLALHKSTQASYRKAVKYGPNSSVVPIDVYCRKIKVILDNRENVEKK